jgi:hypothetical protein
LFLHAPFLSRARLSTRRLASRFLNYGGSR